MMAIRTRFFVATMVGTTILTVLCITTALFLFWQQSAMTEVLRENVSSRRAAVDLEECIWDIAALLKDNVSDVSALNERLGVHLQQLRQVADQQEEIEAAQRLTEGLNLYLEAWSQIERSAPNDRAERVKETLDRLQHQLLEPCQRFRLYNGRRIEVSAQEHEGVLGTLAFGMGGIGLLAGIAGILLGFGVTRSVGQSIRRLQVQIRDVAGKLEAQLPEVILTEVGEGRFSAVHAQLEQLTEGIEHVIRSLRQRELEILRSEQLAAVGQLAAGVAHEIRNPLTAIKMLVQSALESAEDPLTDEDLNVIVTEVRRMEASLKTFLNFARPSQPNRTPFRLADLLQNVHGLVRGRASKQNVTVTIQLYDTDLVVHADAEQLSQVIVNLLLNSLDALPQGGTVQIMSRQVEGQVVIDVCDSGPGISEDMAAKLFQPFASNKETGLGLGLVISRRIIQEHGGTLESLATQDGGALFRIRLPGIAVEVPAGHVH